MIRGGGERATARPGVSRGTVRREFPSCASAGGAQRARSGPCRRHKSVAKPAEITPLSSITNAVIKPLSRMKGHTMTTISPEQTSLDRPDTQDYLKPSFFTAALWAGLLSLIALPIGFGGVEARTAFSPADWYAHEGLFG